MITNESSIKSISAIISTENELELAITELLAESVPRLDISVQGSPQQIKKQYGLSFIAPEIIQNKIHPPIKEPYLKDDMGWIIGFSFAIPFFICLVLGVFVAANIRSTPEVLFYGIIGGLVGAFIGFFIARRVKRKYEDKLIQQEKLGGFVIWVTTHNEAQHEQVMGILKKYHMKNIRP